MRIRRNHVPDALSSEPGPGRACSTWSQLLRARTMGSPIPLPSESGEGLMWRKTHWQMWAGACPDVS